MPSLSKELKAKMRAKRTRAGTRIAVKMAREKRMMDRAVPWFPASRLASPGERDGVDEVGVGVASLADPDVL